MRRRPADLLFLATVLAAILVMSCSATGSLASPSEAIDVLPSPEELPAGTVAVVSHLPSKLRTITAAELRRAIDQALVQSGSRSAPTPGQPKYEEIEEGALGGLLDGLWIQGQAAEMGISASKREVTVELAQIKKESFKTKREFHDFLERAHLTLREARYRVRLQILSRRIQARVSRSTWGEKSPQEALSDFVDAYRKRWRARTVCAAQYATERCSNGPAAE